MEKIIAALRSLSSDLDNISKRMDTIENNIHQWDVDFAKWETKQGEIETSIQKLTEQYVETTTRLDAVVKANIECHEQAETRIDALEHAVPCCAQEDVSYGLRHDDEAFLDSLLSKTTTAQEDARTEDNDTPIEETSIEETKTDAVVENTDIPDILKLNDEDWERVRPKDSTKTRARPKDSTKTRAPSSVEDSTKTVLRTPAHTNVELRAYARQYMIEVMNAKAEQLRDPMAIVKTMETDEFKSWVSSTEK